ncbi:nitrate reductase associated protein [Leptolyngbya valderiana BDU 20041]|nr:nitrate reductase associated protein [Geitlerinema sp. CS-897]OAB63029.1 nitrate reductase associated protein [Leptolyngbya valderiana BDU 20041]PPT05543.1 nitrate reductase associated protein [Geitlerinema sp. FC II]
MHSTASFFQFESDFVESLRCIPMRVRYNLDTCGVKLKLEHWHHFDESERRALVELPCFSESEISAYRDVVRRLVFDRTRTYPKDLPVDPHPSWMSGEIPVQVLEKAASEKVAISTQHWAALSSLQKFALVKLSRPSHENKNFLPALREFGIV